MPRSLINRERVVLAHIVLDPDRWWTHALSRDGSDGGRVVDPEKALADKVARWGPEYDAAVAAGGYKNRVVRQAEEDALMGG
jgi:putative intracellular protease/amidase